jgi:hypothetical protein
MSDEMIVLSRKAAQEIVDYLAQCPYSQVQHLIVHLVTARLLPDIPAEEPEPPSQEVEP